MGDRQGRFILVGEKCEQLLKKMAVADASGSLKTIEYADYSCGKWGIGTFAAFNESKPCLDISLQDFGNRGSSWCVKLSGDFRRLQKDSMMGSRASCACSAIVRKLSCPHSAAFLKGTFFLVRSVMGRARAAK